MGIFEYQRLGEKVLNNLRFYKMTQQELIGYQQQVEKLVQSFLNNPSK